MIKIAQASAIATSAAIVGGLFLLIGKAYKTYVPVAGIGSCVIIDISTTPGYPYLIEGKVIRNNIKEGESSIAENSPNASYPLTVSFEQLRDRVFIKVKCSNE